jgi:hypothetical protein
MLIRILCALGLLLLPVDVLCQGPLLWEVQEDLHGADDFARAVTLSGKVAVVVSGNPVSSSSATPSIRTVRRTRTSSSGPTIFGATRQTRTERLRFRRLPARQDSGSGRVRNLLPRPAHSSMVSRKEER